MDTKEKRDKLREFSIQVYSLVHRISKVIPFLCLFMNTKEKRDKLREFSIQVYNLVHKIRKVIPFFMSFYEYEGKTG